MKKNLLIGLLLLCAGALLSMMATRLCQPKEIVTEIIKTDTLLVERVDTITIIKPEPYKVIVRDTVYLPYPQNPQFPQNPQVFVQEVKEYKDSTYYARISGINAFLEEIRVYPKTTTKYITVAKEVKVKPKRWGIGPTVGVGVMDNKFYPYVGFGVSYNIIQW